jgi:thiamine pyrophosphokinase
MSDVADGVSLKGFKYGLERAKMTPSSLGLSNVTTSAVSGVSLKKGRLLVYIGT